MLVFYSGWGYWEYDSDELEMIVGEGPLLKACSLFELPKDAEKEVIYLGETIVNYLLCSQYSDIEMPTMNHANKDSEPRFVLCEERKGEQMYSIDNRPIIKKEFKYTKDDIKESPVANGTPKNLTETERNTMLKLTKGSKQRKNREDNLTKAIKAAMIEMGKKPSLDELWQYFQDEKDETGLIVDSTAEKIIWIDTKGNMQDTQKASLANRLSRIKV